MCMANYKRIKKLEQEVVDLKAEISLLKSQMLTLSLAHPIYASVPTAPFASPNPLPQTGAPLYPTITCEARPGLRIDNFND